MRLPPAARGKPAAGCSRRELLAFGWLPFWRPAHIALAGARFRILRRGRRARRYLVIHGNEETARAALTAFLQAGEGTGFLIESHTRNVSIDGGVIDPNRMFSRPGAQASLQSLNPDWTPPRIEHALRTLDRGRDRLVQALFPPGPGLLLALHNNSSEYSVADEVPLSDATSLREPSNPHAFFLCTEPADFAALSQSGYNVVLQHNKPQQDDGSLSRLAVTRRARYVNLEVSLGDLNRQLEMLHWADSTLP